MKPWLKITRIPYEEPDNLNLLIEASNGRSKGSLEIYEHRKNLEEQGGLIGGFPRHSADTHVWELGSERRKGKHAFYFRMGLFLTHPGGQCAMQLRFNNKEAPPNTEVADFCIANIEPNNLRKLGTLIQRFAALEHEVLLWKITGGELFTTASEMP